MKKITSLILCLACVLTLASCGKNKEAAANDVVTDESGIWVSETTAQKNGKEDKDDKIGTSNPNKKVEITIPLGAIDEKYRDNLQAYCEAKGYESAKLNKKDGTVTIKMRAITRDLLLTEIGMTVVGAIYEIAGNKKDYPYINKIESFDKDNFSSVVYSVNGKTYKKNSAASYMMAQSCLLYQLYSSDSNYKVTVTAVDKKNNKVIESITYTDKEILNN